MDLDCHHRIDERDFVKPEFKYVVSWDGGIGSGASRESEPLDSLEKAELYVSENLPYGVQKCRTGTYDILKGTLCEKCMEFVEEKTECEWCKGMKVCADKIKEHFLKIKSEI